MMRASRRHFLKRAGAVTAGFLGLELLLTGCSRSSRSSAPVGYGPLVPDPAGWLDLPAGFSYRFLSPVGEVMDDGFVVPSLADGMAAFPAPGGHTVLVRNHEVAVGGAGPFGEGNVLLSRVPEGRMYDRGFGRTPGVGGTTTVVYDTERQRLVGHRLSLAGTERNCAGGPTPWNSWISCEETTVLADSFRERDHGFNFEVPALATGLADPVPLVDMGRFNHEAVAVDAASGAVYETEDRSDGLIYRFLPHKPGRLAAGGRLQALAVVGRPQLDTRNWASPAVGSGVPLAVAWRDLDDVAAPTDDLRYRGFARGAARFARGEGMWAGRDAIYFCCTNGGPAQIGQVWRYTPSPHEGRPEEALAPGRLELFVEATDGSILRNCDNVTVAPWGDLFICEDSFGPDGVVGVTPAGALYRFARAGASSGGSELAGAVFSPDGSTLFVNIQQAGRTLAITGAW